MPVECGSQSKPLDELSRLPPEEAEGIEDLEQVPAYIVKSPRPTRIALIGFLFIAGGLLIYASAEPFLGSLLAVASMLGVPNFVFVQWVAPFVSEFPEMASTFYWARTIVRAPMALMNVVSSNINQWTLLTAMLPVVYSLSRGTPSSIPLDDMQRLELLLTLGQALIGMVFLINMQFVWWEATVIFVLFAVQFLLSPMQDAKYVHSAVTLAYFVWIGVELIRIATGSRQPLAFRQFGEVWRAHVWRARA